MLDLLVLQKPQPHKLVSSMTLKNWLQLNPTTRTLHRPVLLQRAGGIRTMFLTLNFLDILPLHILLTPTEHRSLSFHSRPIRTPHHLSLSRIVSRTFLQITNLLWECMVMFPPFLPPRLLLVALGHWPATTSTSQPTNQRCPLLRKVCRHHRDTTHHRHT